MHIHSDQVNIKMATATISFLLHRSVNLCLWLLYGNCVQLPNLDLDDIPI